MADKSKIEWTDASWNPVTGCTKVSPGCDHCYAETFAERWRGTKGHHFENGFDVQLRPERLDQPLRWKRPRRIFVNSMSDLFHEKVPDRFIAQVFETMGAAKQHTFQLLTKRHARMRSLLTRWSEHATKGCHCPAGEGGCSAPVDVQHGVWPLPNVWLGVSVEDQKRADLRIPALLGTPAAVRWISAEPLLGPIDLARWLVYGCPACGQSGAWTDGRAIRLGDDVDEYWCQTCGAETPMSACTPPGLNWVVCGGESGPGARPMHPDWARSLRDQCVEAGVAFHFKQWGAWAVGYSHGEGEDGPGDTFVNPDGETGHVWFNENLGYPTNFAGPWGEGSTPMSRVGKKRAGRELDGRVWDEFPQEVAVR